MSNIVDADRFRLRPSGRSTGGSDGGNMDDVLRRLGIVETLAAETRIDVSAIKSSFATRADLGAIAADVSAIKATLPHLATRADLSSLETKIIRWIVGTTIAVASVAFTIAKFVN